MRRKRIMGRTYTRCPFCGNSNTAKIIYGYPAYDAEMKQNLDSGKWVLGGCCIDATEINGETVSLQPSRRCNACKKDFGSNPILIDKKTGKAEDYRDIVTSIELSIGGFRDGWSEVSFTKNEEGALVHVIPSTFELPEKGFLRDHQITHAEWDNFVDTLYGRMHLHEWKKKYENPGVLDGTGWTLTIKMIGGRKRIYEGDNNYPPYWKALINAFRKASGYAKLRNA